MQLIDLIIFKTFLGVPFLFHRHSPLVLVWSQGGSGGADTAGLGGKGGPYRFDSGNAVHQMSDSEKARLRFLSGATPIVN